MKPFRDLIVWQKSHELALEAYKRTTGFPKDELFGLTSQIRRSASSIPANIAEGCGRGGEADLGRFFQIAMGSASELEYHILLAKDLGIMSNDVFEPLNEKVIEIKKMLSSFIVKLRTDR